MFANLGFTELAVILAICVVLFGAKRIPEIGSSIGKGIREFKKGVSEIGEPVRDASAVPESAEPLAPRRLQ
jgi:TatA/E family protein of Tat protein translocase